MALPKHRKSKARRDMRKAQHLKVDSVSLNKCPQCGEPKLPHRVCIHCGFYKGMEVIRMEEGEAKK